MKLRIYKPILIIWNKEQIPEEWKEGIICPIFKKGDRRLCSNYRPITLLNVGYKILAILLHNRICRIVEHKLGDYQMGFRPNRSTIDNIFMIRQIYEKCHECNIELHNVFVDFMQAFDSVNRSMIPECLKQCKVRKKLINLVQDTLQATKVKVKINNEMTKQFEITSGVKQGNPLSALLFSIVMDVIMSKIEARGNIATRLKQISTYDDDVVIIGRTAQVMKDTLNKLKNEAYKYGLLINERKTKYMKCTRKQVKENKLEIDNMSFEAVQSFRYPGSYVNKNNTIEEEIKERIIAGNKAFYANRKMFQSKLLSKKTKLKLYRTIIRPILTYASETWVLKEKSRQKLMLFERKILRKIYGTTKESNGIWRIKTNEELDKLIQRQNVIRYIKSQRLKWIGHVERMPQEREVARIYKWKPLASRPIGRPKIRWEDDIRKDLQIMRIKNWKKKVLDRDSWKITVERTKAHNEL